MVGRSFREHGVFVIMAKRAFLKTEAARQGDRSRLSLYVLIVSFLVSAILLLAIYFFYF